MLMLKWDNVLRWLKPNVFFEASCYSKSHGLVVKLDTITKHKDHPDMQTSLSKPFCLESILENHREFGAKVDTEKLKTKPHELDRAIENQIINRISNCIIEKQEFDIPEEFESAIIHCLYEEKFILITPEIEAAMLEEEYKDDDSLPF